MAFLICQGFYKDWALLERLAQAVGQVKYTLAKSNLTTPVLEIKINIMEDTMVLTQLTPQKRSLALERFKLLQPYLEAGVPLAQLAREQNLPLRTLQHWSQQYRNEGLSGLVRKARRDANTHRVLTPELQQLIEGLALQKPAPTIASIYRQVISFVQTQPSQEKPLKLPSYRTVYALVKEISPALQTLAQAGSKTYNNKFDLIYRRDAGGSNEIWQADHCLLDLWVLNGSTQKPSRPWLTVILDDYSRAVAGYALSFEAPSALRTALALRQAIWTKSDPRWHICGIPQQFYTDHGSDFTSQHLEQVSAELKMKLIFSQVGVPRGRGKIERFFETVNQLFLSPLPGYAPAGEGISPSSAKLTLQELEQRFHKFVIEDYHQRVHNSTEALPQQRWERNGFLPQLPASLEQLDLLLLTVPTTRKVQPDGIRFQGYRYFDLNLAAYVGATVTIRYDPRDLAEIRLFLQEQFLCRAVCQELAGAEHAIGLKEIIAARKGQHRRLRQELSERSSLIETLLAAHAQTSSPSDLLELEQRENQPHPKITSPSPILNASPAEAFASNEVEIEKKVASQSKPKLRRYYNE
jgi:putative transposase